MTQTRTERVRRPRDRKQRIVVAAADLFRDRGYHNVSLADVAAEVGITAPALYKHFRNKQELLRKAVDHGMDDLDDAVSNAPSIDEFVAGRAAAARERHSLAALWMREARHLPEDDRRELRRRVRAVAHKLAELVRTARPELSAEDADLLAWALLSVFASLSTHRIPLPRRDFERLMMRLSHVVLDFAVQPIEPNGEPAGATRAAVNQVVMSRREQLLTSAIQLIDEHGYQSVNMTELGAAVGITGPSIYKHYPAKADLLVAALVRGHDRLQAGMTQALSRAENPQQALDLLVRAQIAYAEENKSLIGILISERDQLPERERQRVYRAQRDVLDTWVRVLDEAYPGLSPAEARITINVVFAIINNMVRTRRMAARPDLDEQLARLTMAIFTAR